MESITSEVSKSPMIGKLSVFAPILTANSFKISLFSVAIIVYDITNRDSFDVLKNWIDELNKNGPDNIGK